jgi:hypothetical protein
MELKTCVWYAGDLAHYAVTPDQFGIYQARLIKYEGPDGITPPESVLLVRSARQWVGSYDEAGFIQDLGTAIDERVRDGDPHAL